MLVKIRTFEHKTGYLPMVELDILKVAAHTHEKGTSKNIRGLKTGSHFRSPPLQIDFRRQIR
jgi:hypothetical protein